jgi:hypothetical protein
MAFSKGRPRSSKSQAPRGKGSKTGPSDSTGKQYAARKRFERGEAAHDDSLARLKALEKLMKRKEERSGASSAEALLCRMQLTEACLAAFDWEAAERLLTKALTLDPGDESGARRLLVPIALRLGHHDKAEAVLARWPAEADGSAALRAAALLACLAGWARGESSEEEVQSRSRFT